MDATATQLTKNQAQVLQALSGAAGPVSAYTLLERLRGQGFRAPLQVYRALDKLIEYGMAHRIESMNAFVACAHPDHAHTCAVFAICDHCGRTEEFFDGAVGRRLGGWARDHAFKLDRTSIELRGTCSDCRP
ncbi:Fur family transcriptional regulator [Pigmentiphaga soli]|uniref:Fur family transcriptional regulator n=1 Tax=Pigmentiphaga soli TaxID=1007095 RepID=A0ABP8HES9_9BURK